MTNPPDTSPTLRRRHLLTGSVTATAAGLAGTPTAQAVPHSTPVAGRKISHGILQPHTGPIVGDIYLPSVTDEVTWGYVPTVHDTPTARVRSGRTILIDALSHEGLLEDQGRDPISWFGEHGVRRHHVLADAIDVAARYNRHRRDFDADGPHVVTGPVFVEGAEPGDVLKIETLDLRTRVPLRRGQLPTRQGHPGHHPQRHSPGRHQPGRGDAATCHRRPSHPRTHRLRQRLGLRRHRRWPRPDARRSAPCPFPTAAVLRDDGRRPLGGDHAERPVRALRPSHPSVAATSTSATSAWASPSTCPWRPRAPCSTSATRTTRWARARALTAMEGSLRGTFRLSVCKKGSGDAPSVAFHHPFGETRDAWIPIGLSDPDGLVDGDDTDLNVGRCAGRSSMRSTTCRSTWASPALSPTPTCRRPATSTSASSSTRPPACTA